MAESIKLFLATPWLIAVVVALILFLCGVVIVALMQGRELSFWPPKIGPKNVSEQIQKNASEMAPLKSTPSKKLGAACICYVVENGETKILPVRTSARRWTFPKGGVDKEDLPIEVARRSALEEGGCIGTILEPSVGQYLHRKQDLKLHPVGEQLIDVYLMKKERQIEAPEKHRDPTWVTFEQALAFLSEGRSDEFVSEFAAILARAKIRIDRI